MSIRSFTLTPEGIESQAQFLAESRQRMAEAQQIIFTLAGGGWTGQLAITQLARSFYIDDRTPDIDADTFRALEQARAILQRAAEIRGELQPNHIPDYRGVWLNLGLDW